MDDLVDAYDENLKHRSDSERFYDEEIAPVLAALAKKCEEKDIPFVAAVEYNLGQIGRTTYLGKKAGLAITMQHFCAATGTNIDAYFMHLRRYVSENKIDTSSSMVFNQLTNKR